VAANFQVRVTRCTFSGAHELDIYRIILPLLASVFAELSFFAPTAVKTAGALKIFRKLSARTAGVCYFFSFGQKPIFTEDNYIGA